MNTYINSLGFKVVNVQNVGKRILIVLPETFSGEFTEYSLSAI